MSFSDAAPYCELRLALPRGAGLWLVSTVDGQIQMGHGMKGSHCNAIAAI